MLDAAARVCARQLVRMVCLDCQVASFPLTSIECLADGTFPANATFQGRRYQAKPRPTQADAEADFERLERRAHRRKEDNAKKVAEPNPVRVPVA